MIVYAVYGEPLTYEHLKRAVDVPMVLRHISANKKITLSNWGKSNNISDPSHYAYALRPFRIERVS